MSQTQTTDLKKCPNCDYEPNGTFVYLTNNHWVCQKCGSTIKPMSHPNTEQLTEMKDRIYEIAQEYGSNSDERYQLLSAYDMIFDAIQLIKYKEES